MSTPRKTSHIVHKLNYTLKESLVGIFVLLALVAIVTQGVISSQTLRLFEAKRTYHILLNNPLGVGADTKVRISGLDVGWVTQVDLTEQNTFAITIAVYDKFHTLIRQNSRASISKLAVVGDSMINISSGDINLPPLIDGAEIIAEEDMSIDDMLTKLQPVLDQAQVSAQHFSNFLQSLPTEQIPTIFDNVSTISANLEQLSSALVNGQSTASQLVTDDTVVNEMVATLKQLQQTINQSQQVLSQSQTVLTDSQHAVQQLPELIENSQALVAKTNQQLEQIPALLNNTLQLVTDTQAVVDSVSGMWPIADNMPVQTHEATPLETLPVN